MARQLQISTLDGAAKNYAGQFLRDASPFNRDWVMGQFYNFTFKDEFEYLVEAIRGQLGADALADFDAQAKKKFEPRSDKVFAGVLADKLAIDPDGKHISGKVGTTKIGSRKVGMRINAQGVLKEARWAIYAGEEEERAANSGIVDDFPPSGTTFINEEHLEPTEQSEKRRRDMNNGT